MVETFRPLDHGLRVKRRAAAPARSRVTTRHASQGPRANLFELDREENRLREMIDKRQGSNAVRVDEEWVHRIFGGCPPAGLGPIEE